MALGKTKEPTPVDEVDAEIVEAVHHHTEHKLRPALFHADKPTRQIAMDALQKEIVDDLGEKFPKAEVVEAFDKEVRKMLRNSVL